MVHGRTLLSTGLALAFLAVQPAFAASEEDAALDLAPAAEAAPAARAEPGLRVFVEGTAGRLTQRYGLPSEDVRRLSLDLTWQFKPAAQWRAVVSNRLDDIHPAEQGSRSTLNSLREVYVGWQAADGQWAADLGRVNLRNGPAYGFNPTDYFRDGSARAVTSADPLALRENRLGTAMLRAQRLWEGGNFTLVAAPKLRDGPSDSSFSPDWGATNHANRVLMSVTTEAGSNVNLQGFAFHEQGKGAQVGASGTALLGRSTVGFFEWSGGKDAELLSEALTPSPRIITGHRATVGATFTLPTGLALTAEFEYNKFALDKAGWNEALATYGLEPLGTYLFHVQRRQDIASRKAAMVYASQRNAFVRNLDLTGLVRYNTEDHSRFYWVEARYHFPKVDVALQWQGNRGAAQTEYGAVPGRTLVQLLAAVYF